MTKLFRCEQDLPTLFLLILVYLNVSLYKNNYVYIFKSKILVKGDQNALQD